MTSDAALILLGTLPLFTALTQRGRAALDTFDPWIVAGGADRAWSVRAICLWLNAPASTLRRCSSGCATRGIGRRQYSAWLRLLGALVLAHAGLVVLVVLASGWPRTRAGPAPAIARAPVAPFAVTFVKVFALVPALLATIVAVLLGDRTAGRRRGAAAGAVRTCRRRRRRRQHRASSSTHSRLCLGRPAAGAGAVRAGRDRAVAVGDRHRAEVAQPANAMGRFFADSFERRTGHPLAVVSGDPRTAALVALAAPSRPSVYFDADPARSPSVTADDIREKGAVIVWPAADTNPAPPPDIKAHFPDLVPEVPHAFAAAGAGPAAALLIGWGVIRPASVGGRSPPHWIRAMRRGLIRPAPFSSPENRARPAASAAGCATGRRDGMSPSRGSRGCRYRT